MSLKEKFKNWRTDFISPITNNRDYEFEAEFEDHLPGNQNIYRLYYINYHRIGEDRGMGTDNVGVIDWPYKPFMLPKNMSREDAFKVLSYLIDFIEKTFNLKECSQEGVTLLDEALNLERLGFTRVNIDAKKHNEDIVDLFTVTGRQLLFKQSKHYPKYFNWYTEGVTLEEVSEIYDKCGIEFYDLVPKDKEKESDNGSKTYLKKKQ